MKHLCLVLLLVGLLFAAPSASHGQTPFEARMEQDVHGTWLVFPSESWLSYTVEQSQDLQSWAPADGGHF